MLIRSGKHVGDWAGNIFLPGLHYMSARKTERNLSELFLTNVSPLYRYTKENTQGTTKVEDSLTYDMILAEQARDEERISEDLAKLSEGEQSIEPKPQPVDIAKLRDVNYLLGNFYTIDSTTTANPALFHVDEMLGKSMKINQSKAGPKVLIFHTHSQETFKDSVPGDEGTSIVGMGKYLSDRLNELGVETMHHSGVYDIIDGKLDRSKAYEKAGAAVKNILNQNPSIEVVIDLHRDGVPESTHLVREIDGKQVARLMFFNGLSRTKTQGELTSLPNPYLKDNLALSLQMQLAFEELYPGFTRRIYLKGYRYNLHLMPKSLLIEAGAQTNTVEELKNAMDLLAKVLSKVLL